MLPQACSVPSVSFVHNVYNYSLAQVQSHYHYEGAWNLPIQVSLASAYHIFLKVAYGRLTIIRFQHMEIFCKIMDAVCNAMKVDELFLYLVTFPHL